MFKKRRIKKEFDTAIAEGDDVKIETLMRENPWLRDYLAETGDDADLNLKRVCAAIGIMEDELNTPVPLDEIAYSLDMDFKMQIPSSQLEGICLDLETKGYINNQDGGYTLTGDGSRICDNYLNKQAASLMKDIGKD